jgi:hypothetical protein
MRDQVTVQQPIYNGRLQASQVGCEVAYDSLVRV